MSKKNIITAILISIVLVFLAAGLASSLPDGLERVAQDLGFAQKAAEAGLVTPVTDYSLAGITSPFWATLLAGVLGVSVVFGATCLVGWFSCGRRGIKTVK